jgi:hypothetical protein
MHKDVVYARLYAAFFQAHPEMLTEVRYVPMPDGEEPELVLSIPAVRCLLDWGVAQAYLTDMPRIAALRKALQSVEQGQPHPMMRHIKLTPYGRTRALARRTPSCSHYILGIPPWA